MMLTLQCDTDLTKSLQWLRGRSELCDVVVIGGNGLQSLAHSCVLAAHSTVIAAILQGRLVAARDWSVLRPLVISIDDDTLKTNSLHQDELKDVNVMDTLVGLLYGEAMSVSPAHLGLLHQYAEMLGLSHQIFECLQASKDSCTVLNQAQSTNCPVVARKKHSRKPNLNGNAKKREKTVENEVQEKFSEQNFVNQILSEQKIEKDEPEVKFNVSSTFEERTECSSSIMDLSMLCSEVQGLGSGVNNAWTLAQCHQEQNCEQSSIAELQPGHESVAGFDEQTLVRLEVATEEIAMQDLGSKLDFIHDTSQAGTEMASCTVSQSANDIIGLVVNSEAQQNMCSGETQNAQQPKKQRRQKSMGKSLMCTVCRSSFQKCGDLVKHVQNMQHFTVECPLCYSQIQDPENQRLHFALHDQKLPFFCVYCDLRFRTRADLTMHTPKHSTSKPFVCNECGRGFKWRHALQAHQYTHSPTSRLLCDICGFSSKHVSSFKAHLLQHSGGAFTCPHNGCNFTSKRKTNLNDHLATHSKTRVHQCEVCGHSFSHAKNMRRHMRLHAPASSLLTCSALSKLQCNFRTTRPDKLRDHLAKKHNLTRQTLPSSEPIMKLISSPLPINSVDTPMQPSNVTYLNHIQTTDDTDYNMLQSANEDIPVIEKLTIKLEPKDITSIVEEHVGFQTPDQSNDKVDMEVDQQGSVTTPQDNFSMLVSSPDMADLPDIETLETQDNENEKQQNSSSISDDFPPEFLVDHNILLNKSEVANVGVPQHLDADTVTSMQNNLSSERDHKVQLSVDNSLHSEANLELVSRAHADAMTYSQHCTFTQTDNVVLEAINPTVGEMSSSSTAHSSGIELLQQSVGQKKDDKQEQCMESLNILDFMLDNVTG